MITKDIVQQQLDKSEVLYNSILEATIHRSQRMKPVVKMTTYLIVGKAKKLIESIRELSHVLNVILEQQDKHQNKGTK